MSKSGKSIYELQQEILTERQAILNELERKNINAALSRQYNNMKRLNKALQELHAEVNGAAYNGNAVATKPMKKEKSRTMRQRKHRELAALNLSVPSMAPGMPLRNLGEKIKKNRKTRHRKARC